MKAINIIGMALVFIGAALLAGGNDYGVLPLLGGSAMSAYRGKKQQS